MINPSCFIFASESIDSTPPQVRKHIAHIKNNLEDYISASYGETPLSRLDYQCILYILWEQKKYAEALQWVANSSYSDGYNPVGDIFNDWGWSPEANQERLKWFSKNLDICIYLSYERAIKENHTDLVNDLTEEFFKIAYNHENINEAFLFFIYIGAYGELAKLVLSKSEKLTDIERLCEYYDVLSGRDEVASELLMKRMDKLEYPKYIQLHRAEYAALKRQFDLEAYEAMVEAGIIATGCD